MTHSEKKEEYLRVHDNLDTPFPFAFPEQDTDYGNIEEQAMNDATTCNDNSPCPLGHLASPGVSLLYSEVNLTYQFKDAEVEISLSAMGTDELLLPAGLLTQHSPWFKAALCDRWLYTGDLQEPTPPHKLRRVRYELVFESDGSSYLLRKNVLTPWLERLNADNATLLAFTTSRDRGNASRGYTASSVIDWMPCDALRRDIIESYKIGFGLLLRLPVDLCGLADRPHGATPDYIYESEPLWRIFTSVMIKLFEFADLYSTLVSMGEAIEQLVLGQVGRAELQNYPGQYLRIATVIKSRALFQEACVFACNNWDGVAQLDGIPSGSSIHNIVLTAHIRLRFTIDTAVHQLHHLGFYYLSSYQTWDRWELHERIGQEAWQDWICKQEWSDSYHTQATYTWGQWQQVTRRTLEHIIAGKPDAIRIVNAYMDHYAEAGKSDRVRPDAFDYNGKADDRTLNGPVTRSRVYAIMDRHIGKAVKFAKTVLLVDGPGYIEDDFRLNCVDFGPDVFTYPWESVAGSLEEEVPSSRLTSLYDQATNENSLVTTSTAQRVYYDWYGARGSFWRNTDVVLGPAGRSGRGGRRGRRGRGR